MNRRLKYLRQVLKPGGMTQAEFAKRLGLSSASSVSIWEAGNPIPLRRLYQICQTFHVRPQWLFADEGPMFEDPACSRAKTPKRKRISRFIEDLSEEELSYLSIVMNLKMTQFPPESTDSKPKTPKVYTRMKDVYVGNEPEKS